MCISIYSQFNINKGRILPTMLFNTQLYLYLLYNTFNKGIYEVNNLNRQSIPPIHICFANNLCHFPLQCVLHYYCCIFEN